MQGIYWEPPYLCLHKNVLHFLEKCKQTFPQASLKLQYTFYVNKVIGVWYIS